MALPAGCRQKGRYLLALADAFLDRSHLGCGDAELEKLPEDELFARLTNVKGIGRWSAHMFLLFRLQKRNVMATGDLGVRRGIAKLKGLANWKRLPESTFNSLISSWSPYSSLGCSLM